jgi:hypothetical protein
MGSTQVKHIQVGHGWVAQTANAQSGYVEQIEMSGHGALVEGEKRI